jgi:hypothetical protein
MEEVLQAAERGDVQKFKRLANVVMGAENYVSQLEAVLEAEKGQNGGEGGQVVGHEEKEQ